MIARVRSVLIGFALSSALSACGGGHAKPDGGDGSVDVGGDGGGETDGGGDPNAIVVDTPSGVAATDSQDGFCDLIEAVAAAAGGQSVRECANPNGVKRILLKPGYAYPVGRTLHLAGGTEIGLPDGATERATISAAAGFAGGTGSPSNPTASCLVLVTNGAPDVWLRDVTLTQTPGPALTGACVTKGALDLRRVRVSGFGAGGLSATCLPASGCDHEADSGAATTLRVLNSSIDGNHSDGKGAGIASEGSGATIYVSHSAIVDNASDADGGGVYLGGGWGTDIIQSSTVSGNSSNGVGGGVLVRFAEATWTYFYLLNSTVANNVATGTGGGIQFEPAELGAQDISLYSSIVAANFSGTLEWNINAGWDRPDNPPVFNCVMRSFVYVAPGFPRPTDSGSCVFDVRNPFLGPLMPYGGTGDLPLHPLLAGSPAIDGAPNDTTPDEQRDDWIKDYDAAPPADWMLFDPLVDGNGDGMAVRDIGAYERNDRWQAELLGVRAQGASGVTVVTIPDGYDRGAGTIYAAKSATGEFVTYALPIGEAGRYDVSLKIHAETGAGKFQVAIADNPAGPWTPVGAEQDGYAAVSTFTSLGPFQTPVFASPGEKLLRFTVTGKNAASSGYKLNLDYVEAKKSATACPITDIAAGGNNTCVLLANKGVRCWGTDNKGQLGDGDGMDRASPPATDVVANVMGVAVGLAHTCVLSSDGGVRCWGANANGQLGDGTKADRLQPPTGDAIAGVQALSAGGAHTCVLMTGGGVRCWGANGQGQVGDGTTTDRPTPPSTDLATGMAAVSAGYIHTCALTNAGGVRCWGHNLEGELGIGNNFDTVIAPPGTDVLTGVKQVVAANVFTCALLATGGVRCWGLNSHGEIGDDTIVQVDRLSPAAVDVLGGAASLATGLTHVCARMTSGGGRCWGGNDSGQLGDGLRPIFALTPPTMDGPGFTGTCP